MASFVEVLAVDMMAVNLVPMLNFSELSDLESLCTTSLQAIVTSSEWAEAACSELKHFGMASVLKDEPDRRTLKCLIANLSRLDFADKTHVALNGLKQAQELVRVTSRAKQMVDACKADEEQMQHVVVGCFRFPDMNDNCADGTRPKIHVSDAIRMRLTRRSAAGGKEALLLKLILSQNKMYLSAKWQGQGQVDTGAPPKFLVDVQAVSKDVVLQMRNVNVSADGNSIKSGSGIFTAKGSDSSARGALFAGLTCVVTVRDRQNIVAPHRCVSDALCLDRIH